MFRYRHFLMLAVLGLVLLMVDCGSAKQPVFSTIALGTEGGLAEGNLTSFLLAERGTNAYVALDAGNLLTGLREAKRQGSLRGISPPPDSKLSLEGWVLKHGIKAYLISHAHLDHVAGLVINSTDDGPTPIVGLNSTIDFLVANIFNWETWPNFGDEGKDPLKLYELIRLSAGEPYRVPGTGITVWAYPLSHHRSPSTAFLIRVEEDYAVYVGDTGPDPIEKSTHLRSLWILIAPLVREGKVRAIYLEASFPDDRPDELLFGHLTPGWVMKEMNALAGLVDEQNPKKALRGLTVIVTHIKPTLMKGPTPREQIRAQLKKQNDLGIRFVLPEQGQRIDF